MARVTLSRDASRYLNSIGIAASVRGRSARPAALANRAIPPRPEPAQTARGLILVRVLGMIIGILVFFLAVRSVCGAELPAGEIGPVLEAPTNMTVSPGPVASATAIWSAASTSIDSAFGSLWPRASWAALLLVGLILMCCTLFLPPLVLGIAIGMWLRHQLRLQGAPVSLWVDRQLAAWRRRSSPLAQHTIACPTVWGLGLASVVGPVRAENQDHAVAWDHEQFRIIVVADGMGGLPRGREAARTAGIAAARELTVHVADRRFLHDPLRAMQDVFNAASIALKLRSAIAGYTSGLRTTLIAVIATPTQYVWGWIGDGGFWIYRSDGSLRNILTGHKDPSAPNVLFHSLGPVAQGIPEIGSTPRQPGDVLFVGSDGVFDRIADPTAFCANVVSATRTYFNGDLQRAVEEVIRQFSVAEDDDGRPVCDDNMTLVVTTPDNRDPDEVQVDLSHKEARIA